MTPSANVRGLSRRVQESPEAGEGRGGEAARQRQRQSDPVPRRHGQGSRGPPLNCGHLKQDSRL